MILRSLIIYRWSTYIDNKIQNHTCGTNLHILFNLPKPMSLLHSNKNKPCQAFKSVLKQSHHGPQQQQQGAKNPCILITRTTFPSHAFLHCRSFPHNTNLHVPLRFLIHCFRGHSSSPLHHHPLSRFMHDRRELRERTAFHAQTPQNNQRVVRVFNKFFWLLRKK